VIKRVHCKDLRDMQCAAFGTLFDLAGATETIGGN
jgi:hypothetical protein